MAARAALWLAAVAAPLPPHATTWHDADETARLERTTAPAERRRRAVAWSLRRWALTQAWPAVAPADWRFRAGPHGKPTLAPPFDRLGLHHNLSHGGSYAAVLVAETPCGIDVEAPPVGLEAATVVFGPSEQADIAAHPRPTERFLQHWVAMEAALKLRGTGFDTDPEALHLTLAPDGRSALPQPGPDGAPAFTVHLWPLAEGHWLAVALQGSWPKFQPAWAPWSTSAS